MKTARSTCMISLSLSRSQRVGLAGEDDLHGALRVAHDLRQSLDVLEDERSTLVQREAAGEADRESILVQRLVQLLDHRGVTAVEEDLLAHRLAQERDHLPAQHLAEIPDRIRGDLVHLLPPVLVRTGAHPAGLEMAVVEGPCLIGEPGFDVDPVGDGLDRNLRRLGGVEGLHPHAAGRLGVQLRHAVAVLRQLQRQHGHAEGFLPIGFILAAKREQFVAAEAKSIGVVAEEPHEEARLESIVALRDGRVRREDGGLTDVGTGFVKRDATVDKAADALQSAERGVPFVEVIHRRLDAELVQCDEAAEPEEHFLPDAIHLIATVEVMRELPIGGLVGGQVGVEQVQIRAADGHLPDLGLHLGVADRNRDGLLCIRDRDRAEVVARVEDTHLAVELDLLPVVAVSPEHADAHQRHTEVGGRTQVVAGEHAQAAGVQRERFVQPVLHAEVRDQHVLRRPRGLTPEPGLGPEVGAESGLDAIDRGVEGVVGIQCRATHIIELLEHRHGVVPGEFPQVRVHGLKKVPSLRIPRPPEVVGETFDSLQDGRA